MHPCTPCARLDGEGSTVPPHPALALEASFPVQADDLDAGAVESYVCKQCEMRLQRLCRACGLDGWLVLRPRKPVRQVSAND